MKKTIFGLLLVMLLSGCSTVTFTKPSVKSRFDYIEANNITDKYIKAAIRRGSVIHGMNEEQVLAAWGKPIDKVQVNDEAQEADTKWFYKGLLDITVEFANGLVLGVYYNT
jgi:hypothetical protein